MGNKYSKRQEREYDAIRKQQTLEKLKTGIRQLKNRKEYRDGKAVTNYALSKHTGIAYNTIKKYPEIVRILEKEKNPGIPLKKAVVNVDKIYNIEEAILIIEQLTNLYNSTKEKYNEGLKINSSLNLQIVRLKDQVNELNRQINKYREKIKD